MSQGQDLAFRVQLLEEQVKQLTRQLHELALRVELQGFLLRRAPGWGVPYPGLQGQRLPVYPQRFQEQLCFPRLAPRASQSPVSMSMQDFAKLVGLLPTTSSETYNYGGHQSFQPQWSVLLPSLRFQFFFSQEITWLSPLWSSQKLWRIWAQMQSGDPLLDGHATCGRGIIRQASCSSDGTSASGRGWWLEPPWAHVCGHV